MFPHLASKTHDVFLVSGETSRAIFDDQRVVPPSSGKRLHQGNHPWRVPQVPQFDHQVMGTELIPIFGLKGRGQKSNSVREKTSKFTLGLISSTYLELVHGDSSPKKHHKFGL